MQTILKYLIYIHVAQHITQLIVRLYQLLTLMLTQYESLPNLIKNIITKNDFVVSQNHSIDKELLKIVELITLDLLLGTYELYNGIWAWFWIFSEGISLGFGCNENNNLVPTIVFLIVLCFWSSIKRFPIKLLEKSVQGTFKNHKDFMKEELRSFVHNVALVSMFSGLLYISVFKNDCSLLWLSLFTAPSLIIGHFLYWTLLEPICLKYRRLEEGTLRTSIESMLAESDFRSARIYVTERPTKCTFRHVQIYSFWKLKRVVLYSNLMKINDLTNEEIVAVVSHELGHWKKNHMWIWFAVIQEIILVDIMTSMWIMSCGCIFKAIGLSCFYRPTIVALLVSKVFVSGSLVVQCLSKLMFRCFEFQADNFAKSLGNGENLANALVKIGKDKKEFPVNANVYIFSLLSQPSTLQRVRNLVKEKDE